MPGSLLTMFLGWLATHLVAWTVLAFLLVWLVLSGTLVLPGHWSQLSPSDRDQSGAANLSAVAEQPSPAAPDPRAGGSTPASRPPSGKVSARDIVAAERAPEVRSEAGRGQPRMIGGTIPLYSDPAGSFRPSMAISDPLPPGYDERVQQARRSFWNGDFEAAERTYTDILDRFPDDADVYGELGNLYLAMGRNALALDAYFEAGLRLRAAGEHVRLAELIEIFKKNDDDRGLQLSAKP